MRLLNNRITNAVLTLLIAFSLLILIISEFSFGRIAVVLTGSMEPALPKGALAFTIWVNPGEVEVGDILAFRSEEDSDMTTSHRVVEVLTEGDLFFRTKGDANEEADPRLVPADGVTGKVFFNVPQLGTIFMAVVKPLRSWPSFILLIAVPSLLIIGSTIRDLKRPLSLRQKRMDLIAKRRRQWKASVR